MAREVPLTVQIRLQLTSRRKPNPYRVDGCCDSIGTFARPMAQIDSTSTPRRAGALTYPARFSGPRKASYTQEIPVQFSTLDSQLPNQLPAEMTQRLLELFDGRLRAGANHDDPVGMGGKLVAQPAEGLANQALSAIPDDRRAHRFSNRDSKPRVHRRSAIRQQSHPAVGRAQPMPENAVEVPLRANSRGTGKRGSCWGDGHSPGLYRGTGRAGAC